jgi:predicted RNA-binding Zn ribbon-like protein
MSPTVHEWSREDFVAGELCLEFTNTVGDHTKTRSVEWLPDYRALAQWGVMVGVLEAAEAQEFRKLAARDATLERRSLRRLLVLRERLFRVLSSLAAGRPPDSKDLREVRVSVLAAYRASRLMQQDHHFEWTVPAIGTPMKSLTSRIALSAARLLQSDELARLRECQRCSWLFLDRSKSHGRRWCRPDACGNRARVARHYRSRAD